MTRSCDVLCSHVPPEDPPEIPRESGRDRPGGREQLLFDFVFDGIEDAAGALLDQYLSEAHSSAKRLNWRIAPDALAAGQTILGSDRHLQTAVLLAALNHVITIGGGNARELPLTVSAIAKLISRIARRRLPLKDGQPEGVVSSMTEHASALTHAVPVLGILFVVRRHMRSCGFSADLATSLRELQNGWVHDWYFNPLHLIQRRISEMLGHCLSRRLEPCPGARAV